MKNNKINLVLASDQNYVKLLVPCIISILYNKNPTTEIDIYILENDISSYHKQKIKELENFNNITNCKIEFIDIKEKLQNLTVSNLIAKERYSSTILYRLAIPILFSDFERMLYLDVDTIVRDDLLSFYNQCFDNNYIIALKCRMPPEYKVFITTYNNKQLTIKDFLITLGITRESFNKGAESYINAGVLLFNIRQIIKDEKDKQLINNCIEYVSHFPYSDQDILLITLKDKIKNTTYVYNCIIVSLPDNLSVKEKIIYRERLQQAKVYHFADYPKITTYKKLYKTHPVAYKEFYKYYQMSYLRMNSINWNLYFYLLA